MRGHTARLGKGICSIPVASPGPGRFAPWTLTKGASVLPMEPKAGRSALDPDRGAVPGDDQGGLRAPWDPARRVWKSRVAGGDPHDPRAAGLNILEPRARCFGSGAFDQGETPWNPSTAGEQP